MIELGSADEIAWVSWPAERTRLVTRLRTDRASGPTHAEFRRMMISSCRLVVSASLIAALLAVPTRAQEPSPKPAPQNPSPMVEHTRAHERLDERDLPGVRLTVDGLLAQPVKVFIPRKAAGTRLFRLLIHFHGAAFVPEHAVSHVLPAYVLAVVNLGPGSAVYENAFRDPAVFDRFLDAMRERLKSHSGGAEFSTVALSAFSAGHGAIRSILREPRQAAAVGSVLLLDGLHAGYLPPADCSRRGWRARRRPAHSLPSICGVCDWREEGTRHHALGDLSGHFRQHD